jgi:hypothetical protein
MFHHFVLLLFCTLLWSGFLQCSSEWRDSMSFVSFLVPSVSYISSNSCTSSDWELHSERCHLCNHVKRTFATICNLHANHFGNCLGKEHEFRTENSSLPVNCNFVSLWINESQSNTWLLKSRTFLQWPTLIGHLFPTTNLFLSSLSTTCNKISQKIYCQTVSYKRAWCLLHRITKYRGHQSLQTIDFHFPKQSPESHWLSTDLITKAKVISSQQNIFNSLSCLDQPHSNTC